MRGGEVGAGRQERAWGVVAAHKRHAKGWPDSRLGAKGTRGERTWNMVLMVVTLEVSKLSGWLKANAYCRVEGRACDAGGERCEPGGGRACGVCGGGTQEACTGVGPTQGLWGPRARAERTRNMLLMSLTLEVSMLSGWLKAFASCRVEGRAHAMRGGEVRAGRREGLGCGGGTQEACTGMARLKAWGPRARAERTRNM